MVLYDWANGDSVGAFFMAWYGFRSMREGGGEFVLFQGMDMEFSENIVLGGSKKEYCKYGPATGISCWIYDVLRVFRLTRLSGLMGTEAYSRAGVPCSFPRRGDPQFSYCVSLSQKARGEKQNN